MTRTSFYRPLCGGFAVTAMTLAVAPMSARAETPAAAGCEAVAPAKTSHGLKFGHLLAAARQSGMGQLLGGGGLGGGRGGLLMGTLANTAIEAAASTPKADIADRSAGPCELARN